MAKRSVVIIKDTLGSVCFIAYPKMLEENEINKAINKANEYQQMKDKEIIDMKDDILLLKKEIEDLRKEIKYLKGE